MASDPHRISLEDAIPMVQRARAGKLLPVHGWMFEAAIVREILAQAGCAGLRIYLAAKAEGDPTAVLVGTDAEGRDLVEGTLAEYSQPCPPWCDEGSPFVSAQS